MQYSYKIDRLSGDVLPVIVDKYNHYIDAIRYALEKVMISKESPAGILIPGHLLNNRR
jgi:phage terminase large subunit